MEDLKTKLKQSISKGLTKAHFENLKMYVLDNDLMNGVINLQSQFIELENSKNKDIIFRDEYVKGLNKVRDNLLNLIDSIDEKEIQPALLSENSKDNINDKESIKVKLDIYLLRKKLASAKRYYIYKKQFYLLTNSLEVNLSEHFNRKGFKYEIKKSHQHLETKGKLKKRKVITGIDYHIDDVMITINFCFDFLTVGIRTQQDKDKYKIRWPESLRLEPDENANLIWVKKGTKENPKDLHYTKNNLVDILTSDVVDWLFNKRDFSKPVVFKPQIKNEYFVTDETFGVLYNPYE